VPEKGVVMKNMKVVLIALSMLMALPVFAQDGVVSQDKKDIKEAKENVMKDKASGNTEALQKDKKVLKQARRSKHQIKDRLKKDKQEIKKDETKS
jgi:hypothetical protein